MKIAVIDSQVNFGGGMRYLVNLVLALKKNRPNNEIRVYCNLNKLTNNSNLDALTDAGVEFFNLKSTQQSKKVTLWTRVRNSLIYRLGLHFRPKQNDSYSDEILAIAKSNDLLFFPWPYFTKFISVDKPIVGTFHDFNFMYNFGVSIFSEQERQQLKNSLAVWLQYAHPVVSSDFIKTDLLRFFQPKHPVSVIRLASLNSHNLLAKQTPPEFQKFQSFNQKQFFLCPIHLTSHKNASTIIAATSILNKTQNIVVVFVGSGSEVLNGNATYIGLSCDDTSSLKQNVFGLGYIGDAELNYLLKKCKGVINASLYEAGNGVGLDAWELGVPVIQSSIPPFMEHLNKQNYCAYTFDVRNPYELADVMGKCITDTQQTAKNVAASMQAASINSWAKTATAYQNLFDQIINNNLK